MVLWLRTALWAAGRRVVDDCGERLAEARTRGGGVVVVVRCGLLLLVPLLLLLLRRALASEESWRGGRAGEPMHRVGARLARDDALLRLADQLAREALAEAAPRVTAGSRGGGLAGRGARLPDVGEAAVAAEIGGAAIFHR